MRSAAVAEIGQAHALTLMTQFLRIAVSRQALTLCHTSDKSFRCYLKTQLMR